MICSHLPDHLFGRKTTFKNEEVIYIYIHIIFYGNEKCMKFENLVHYKI